MKSERKDEPPSSSSVGELERPAALHGSGALSDDEFQSAKRRVLGPQDRPETGGRYLNDVAYERLKLFIGHAQEAVWRTDGT